VCDLYEYVCVCIYICDLPEGVCVRHVIWKRGVGWCRDVGY